MKPTFKPKFTKEQIQAFVQKKKAALEFVVLEELKMVGEKFIINARTKTAADGGFNDRTGNLRSSIGYVVLKNGLQLSEGGFVVIKKGSDGTKTGKTVIEHLSKKHPSGLVLLCVAGMNYASLVEAKNKDVITGSSLIATEDLKKAMQEVRDELRKGR